MDVSGDWLPDLGAAGLLVVVLKRATRAMKLWILDACMALSTIIAWIGGGEELEEEEGELRKSE